MEAIQVADAGLSAAGAHLAKVPDSQEALFHCALLLARMGMADVARLYAVTAREMAPTGC